MEPYIGAAATMKQSAIAIRATWGRAVAWSVKLRRRVIEFSVQTMIGRGRRPSQSSDP
jgi:hypothetical protein